MASAWAYAVAWMVIWAVLRWLEPEEVEVDERAPMVRSFRAHWQERARIAKSQ